MRTLPVLLTMTFVPATVSASTGNDPAPEPSASVAPDVVGGRQAPAGKWNDAAAAMSGDQPICSGTLIAPNVVITAGHCINVGIDSVKLGVNDFTSPGGETIAVSRQVSYPKLGGHL